MTELARAAFGPYVPRIGREPAPMRADHAAAVARGGAWVAEQEGRLVGLLILEPAGDHLLLDTVAVAPPAQGRGIGARLLGRTEAETRAAGLAEVGLYTNEAMTENLALYARHGYQETHRASQDGFRRVYFSKRLGTGQPRPVVPVETRPQQRWSPP